LGLGPGTGGKYFLLSPASLSALSYEHNLSHPVIRLWNDDHHVASESAQLFGEKNTGNTVCR
jgi:probable phosphoglycerate mutase